MPVAQGQARSWVRLRCSRAQFHTKNPHFDCIGRTFRAGSSNLRTNMPYSRLVDNLDFSIIDLLRQNARAGYGDIGTVVGLSASAVKRRVDRMIADGVIRGFTVQVDPAVDGLATEAYVELFCRGTVSPAELQRILITVPEVVDAGTVTGSADAMVHMRSRDIPSLEGALERVRNAPNVDHTRSAIMLSKLINRQPA
ncbi:MAG: AsnC family transcriptional regulator [Frondihabitans sp.]|nr:AsnC family transcriptional regulator [Frondihabitans sp.]